MLRLAGKLCVVPCTKDWKKVKKRAGNPALKMNSQMTYLFSPSWISLPLMLASAIFNT